MTQSDFFKILPIYDGLKTELSDFEKKISEKFGVSVTLIIQEMESDLTMDAIVQIVSNALKISVGSIFNRSRTQPCVEARKVAMYLIWSTGLHTKYSPIASYFGMDRTSVKKAIDGVFNLIDAGDEQMTEKVRLAMAALYNKMNIHENAEIHE